MYAPSVVETFWGALQHRDDFQVVTGKSDNELMRDDFQGVTGESGIEPMLSRNQLKVGKSLQR